MKKYYILIVYMFISVISNAQSKHDYIWLSGYTYLPVKGNIIDFNNKGRIDSMILGNSAIGGNNTIISDKNGNLLFYSNGCKILNSSHGIMENGDSINFGETWKDHCSGFHAKYPGSQNSIVLSDPGNIDRDRNGYYLIHKRYEIIFEPIIQAFSPNLYFTYIDMNKNNGNGQVKEKNQIIFSSSNMPITYLTACKHANKKDWWIIEHKKDTNLNYVVLLNSDSITLVDSIYIGSTLDAESGFGQAKFSPDGSKYVLYNKEDGALVYDFDRETGKLSNLRQIEVQDSSSGFVGLAISPNSRYAYLSSTLDLYQIDLMSDDIQSSLIHIDHWDGFNDFGFAVLFSNAQLAPDCKIYISSPTTVLHMSVINKPNEKGKACDFRQHAIKFPNLIAHSSIPNFPHFRIDEENICDSTITWLPEEYLVKEINVLSVYPNPTSSKSTISIYSYSYEYGKIRIKDINGKIIKTLDINSDNKLEIDLSSFVSGMYFVEYVSFVNGGRDVKKLVIVE